MEKVTINNKEYGLKIIGDELRKFKYYDYKLNIAFSIDEQGKWQSVQDLKNMRVYTDRKYMTKYYNVIAHLSEYTKQIRNN